MEEDAGVAITYDCVSNDYYVRAIAFGVIDAASRRGSAAPCRGDGLRQSQRRALRVYIENQLEVRRINFDAKASETCIVPDTTRLCGTWKQGWQQMVCLLLHLVTYAVHPSAQAEIRDWKGVTRNRFLSGILRPMQ